MLRSAKINNSPCTGYVQALWRMANDNGHCSGDHHTVAISRTKSKTAGEAGSSCAPQSADESLNLTVPSRGLARGSRVREDDHQSVTGLRGTSSVVKNSIIGVTHHGGKI